MTIRRQLLLGTLWSAVGVYGSAGMALIVTVLLARWLAPSDFGLIAAALSLTAFLEGIVDVGGSSIVQRSEATREELSSIFWAVLTASVLVYATLAASAGPIADFLGIPLLSRALPLVAVNTIAFGLLIVPLALTRQRREFKKVAVVQTLAAAISGAVALTLASRGYGYRALIVQSVLLVTTRTTGMWIVARWRPRLWFRLSDLGPFVTYSGPLVAAVLINTWSRNLDAIFLARLAGVAALGHYNLAFRLVSAPMILITAGLRPQLHPLFASIRHDAQQVREAFRATVVSTALVSFSLASILWVTAEPLVLAFWGPAWAPTITVVRAFGFLMAVQPVGTLSASLFLTHGETALLLRLSVVNSLLLVIAMAIGAAWLGAPGVAWAYSLVVATVALPRNMHAAYVRLCGGSVSDLSSALLRPCVFAICILLAGTATDLFMLQLGEGPLPRLVAVVTAALLALLLAARLFAWDLVLSVVRTLRER